MSARAQAALWMAAIAMAWLFVGLEATGAQNLRHSVEGLVDVQVARLHANVLRTVLRLRPWVDLAPAWLPVLLAGLLDGMTMRLARRCGLEPAPDLGLQFGRHALIALVFAPVLAASLAVPHAPWVVAAWGIAMAASLSFTLSRVQGLGSNA